MMSSIAAAAVATLSAMTLLSSCNPIIAFSTCRPFERTAKPSLSSPNTNVIPGFIRNPNGVRSSTARKLSPIDSHSLLTDIMHSSSTILSDLDVDIVDSVSSAAALSASADTVDASSTAVLAPAAAAVAAATATADVGFKPAYSKASYYTTLGLYILSFPGIWSQVKRSTKAKMKRKTFLSDGEAANQGKDLRQQAGEIMAYMKANNYEVVEAGEVITFRGIVKQSISQACFLVFCTVLAMASLALVLQIQLQDFTIPFLGIKPNWFYLVALGPYAGVYYWKSGDRVDDVKVKLASNDDETQNEITVEGNDEEIERMWRTLEWNEKGMVKIEGLLEGA